MDNPSKGINTFALHVLGDDVVYEVRLDGGTTVADLKALTESLGSKLVGQSVRALGLPKGNAGATLNEMKLKAPHPVLIVPTSAHSLRIDDQFSSQTQGDACPGIPNAASRNHLIPRHLVKASMAMHRRLETPILEELVLQVADRRAVKLDPTVIASLTDQGEVPVLWSDEAAFAARVALRVATYAGYVRLHPLDAQKKTLVLDIDKTLMDTDLMSSIALGMETHGGAGEGSLEDKGIVLPQDKYANDSAHKRKRTASEWRRPHLHEFLSTVFPYYNLIVWSATGIKHVQTKLADLGVLKHSEYKISLLVDYGAMIRVRVRKGRLDMVFDTKPLSVLYGLFGAEGGSSISPLSTLMIDDHRRSFVMDPDNGLHIHGYRASEAARASDVEFQHLARYLLLVRLLPSVLVVDHSKWRRVALATDALQELSVHMKPEFHLQYSVTGGKPVWDSTFSTVTLSVLPSEPALRTEGWADDDGGNRLEHDMMISHAALPAGVPLSSSADDETVRSGQPPFHPLRARTLSQNHFPCAHWRAQSLPVPRQSPSDRCVDMNPLSHHFQRHLREATKCRRLSDRFRYSDVGNGPRVHMLLRGDNEWHGDGECEGDVQFRERDAGMNMGEGGNSPSDAIAMHSSDMQTQAHHHRTDTTCIHLDDSEDQEDQHLKHGVGLRTDATRDETGARDPLLTGGGAALKAVCARPPPAPAMTQPPLTHPQSLTSGVANFLRNLIPSC